MTVSVKIETVTPKEAQKFLGLNTHNRASKPREVEQMARDMAEGRWILNGESIKLGALNGGPDDVLADGQNRALAVVKSGATIQSVVVRGLSYEAVIATIDAGAKRTMGDIIKLLRHEKKNYSHLAGVLSWAYRQEHRKGRDRGFTGSHVELLAYLDANPSLREVTKLAIHARRLFPPLKAAPFGAALFHGLRVDGEATRRFANEVATGEDLKRRQPAYVLREWLSRATTAARTPSVDAYPHVINGALIAELEGRDIGRLVYRSSNSFPYVQDAEVIEA